MNSGTNRVATHTGCGNPPFYQCATLATTTLCDPQRYADVTRQDGKLYREHDWRSNEACAERAVCVTPSNQYPLEAMAKAHLAIARGCDVSNQFAQRHEGVSKEEWISGCRIGHAGDGGNHNSLRPIVLRGFLSGAL
jgi:hypothetical protein